MDDYNDAGSTITFLRAGQKIFARYVLVRLLGRGGMGVVWMAKDEELQRNVALKFVPELLAADRDAIVDLKREVRRTLELTHPNIVRSYDFVADARHAAISMEFVPGATYAALRSEQPHGHFEVAELAPSVRQLCKALSYAHTKAKVVHRDLKPANLMLDALGELKIADFGIAATLADSHTRLSQRASASGTPLYMSPQQMMGEKPAVTDDIYALGATLYELLTGKPPFHSGRIDLQLLNKLPTRLAVRREELEVPGQPIPETWEETIAACLAKEPANRPQSAREVLERLDLLTTRLASNPESAPARPDSASVASSASPRANEPAITRPTEPDFVAKNKASVQPIATPAKETPDRPQGAPDMVERSRSDSAEDPKMARETRANRPDEPPKKVAPAAVRAAPILAEPSLLRSLLRISWRWFTVATLAAVGLAYYFGVHAPEQQRIELARLEAMRAEQLRLASARGGLILRTEPAGAEVAVGGVGNEKSPATFKELRLGRYEVTVTKPGYESQTLTLDVEENRFTDPGTLALKATLGKAMLTTEPAGVDYELVSTALAASNLPVVRRTGLTPVLLEDLPVGDYHLSFQRAGWADQKTALKVEHAAIAEGNGDFVGGALRLASEPAGLEWRIVETPTGVRMAQMNGHTPQELTDLPVGRYTVAYLRDGSVPEQRLSVEVTKGAMVSAIAETVSDEAKGAVTPQFQLGPGEKRSFPRVGQPWQNTLGQRFVPVPNTAVLFCIWETRERDYVAFVQATGQNWSNANDGPDHPAVNVSWNDAVAFCAWLTKKERSEGKLGPKDSYRLPTDAEWSRAVELDEPSKGSPHDKDSKTGEYPWGNRWPPRKGVGNYSVSLGVDSYEQTAPVGSFAANRYGLHDLGGNVWEWCEDFYDGVGGDRVMRGASFFSRSEADALQSSSRDYSDSSSHRRDLGFRIVIAFDTADFAIASLVRNMVKIAPGSFEMGSASGGSSDERPVTRVTITQPYWLGETELTQAQWIAIMGSNPSYFEGADRPVENVSWNEAMEFCRKLTAREQAARRLPKGFVYTLPTEAQWEYACRAGTIDDYAGDVNAMGWHNENSGSQTHPVGQKQANLWGLHDMHGNVWEYCLDWIGKYSGDSLTDPTGPTSGANRVCRGGSWGVPPSYCRSAVRGIVIGTGHNLVGFRLALSSVP